MRRAVAAVTTVALLTGCGSDASAPEKQPVEHEVVLSVDLRGHPGIFNLQLNWGHATVGNQRETVTLPAWRKALTVTWPDNSRVYVDATPVVKPGVDATMAHSGGTPEASCVIKIDGRIAVEDSGPATSCQANLTGETARSGAAG